MHLLGGTPAAPFSKLKNAAQILQNFSNSRLSEDNIFQRLEKRNIDKLLVSFWQVMAPFENVKIVEKNTELLHPSAIQEEEKKQEVEVEAEAKAIPAEDLTSQPFLPESVEDEEEEKQGASSAPQPEVVEEEKPKARPNFPIVVKRNPYKPQISEPEKPEAAQSAE